MNSSSKKTNKFSQKFLKCRNQSTILNLQINNFVRSTSITFLEIVNNQRYVMYKFVYFQINGVDIVDFGEIIIKKSAPNVLCFLGCSYNINIYKLYKYVCNLSFPFI